LLLHRKLMGWFMMAELSHVLQDIAGGSSLGLGAALTEPS
jgi:hypothetical protein